MSKINELLIACKGAVEYLRMYCNPHQAIIIDNEKIKIVSDDVGIPLDNSADQQKPTG